MPYKGNYNQNTTGIQSTIKCYVENSGGAEVWGGLHAHHSDNDLTRLSAAELTADCKTILAGGESDLTIFKWAIANLFNF